MARPVRTSLPLEEDELRKRGYYVGALLGEGSYAKVILRHSPSPLFKSTSRNIVSTVRISDIQHNRVDLWRCTSLLYFVILPASD